MGYSKTAALYPTSVVMSLIHVVGQGGGVLLVESQAVPPSDYLERERSARVHKIPADLARSLSRHIRDECVSKKPG